MSSKSLLNDLHFCVIDLETTGGNHESDQIIEIGMVKIRKQKISESKNFLINPKKRIPEFIQKLTSISQADVEDAPVIEQVIDEIIEFIGDDILVAHNTSFDVPFLNSVMRRLGRPEFNNKVLCTNIMTKHMIPEVMTSNLNYMSHLFQIEHENAHRAEDDAYAAAKLLLKYLEIFEVKGIKKVNQLYYPRNKFELDRVNIYRDQMQDSEILAILEDTESPLTLTFKSDKGIIEGVLPISLAKQEIEFIKSVLNLTPWHVITIKMQSPFLECLIDYSNHYLKFNEAFRSQVDQYLTTMYCKNEKTKSLDQFDFIVGHHLIKNQIIVYSFLNLYTQGKNIFKIPAHKKKMSHFLRNQISRYENQQKGSKKVTLQPIVAKIVSQQLEEGLKNSDYLAINRKEYKHSPDKQVKNIESFVFKRSQFFNFPTKHI